MSFGVLCIDTGSQEGRTPLSAEWIIQRLKQVPLFSRLDRPQLRALAGLVQRAEHPPGSVIYRQGDTGDHRYFIVEGGSLRVRRVDTSGRPVEVGRVEEGGAFGETSLMLGDVRDVTVETLERTVLFYIEKEAFDRFLGEHGEVERRLRMRPEVAERRRYPRFSWLEEGELPVKILNKHPAILVTNLLIPGLLGLLLLLASVVGRSVWGNLVLFAGLVLVLLPAAVCGYLYIDWRNDMYVVTNRRVIHRERTGLLEEHFAAAPLRAIQDISQVQTGIVAHLWDFGVLIMETAGEVGQVVFRSIPHPAKVREIVFEQIERARARTRAGEHDAIMVAMQRHFYPEGQEGEGQRPGPGTPQPEPKQTAPQGRLRSVLRLARGFAPPAWQRGGDTITWRKHWIGLFRHLGAPILIFTVVTVAVGVTAMARPDLLRLLLFPFAIGVLVLVPWLLWQFEDWQNDFYQVTPTRLIHVDRLPFYLREERREASLEKITNVRFEQSAWGKMLRFGDVIVETASPAGTFHLRTVSHPQRVQSEIFSRMEVHQQLRQQREADRHQAELLDWFSVYDRIRQDRSSSTQREESG